jgi:hypothetical protein
MEKFDIDGLASRPTILLTTVVSALGQEYELEREGQDSRREGGTQRKMLIPAFAKLCHSQSSMTGH